jgi:thioredoxin
MNRVLYTGLFLLLLLSDCNSQRNSRRDDSGPTNGKGIAIYLTEKTFKEKVFNYDTNKEWKYEGAKPAIIDFYADWCAPCRELSPRLEEVVKGYGGKVILYKIDTQKESKLTETLGVSALPTLLYIPLEGKPQVRMGLVPKESIKQAINDILLKK